MASIITKKLHQMVTDSFMLAVKRMGEKVITDNQEHPMFKLSNLYMFIGSPLPWTDMSDPEISDTNPPIPDASLGAELNYHLDMLALEEIDKNYDLSYCVRRFDWEAGTIFFPFDLNDPYYYEHPTSSSSNCEILDANYIPDKDRFAGIPVAGSWCITTVGNEYLVWLCLDNHDNNPTATNIPNDVDPYECKPKLESGEGAGTIKTMLDGYKWMYLYTIQDTKFLDAIWMPLNSNTEDVLDTLETVSTNQNITYSITHINKKEENVNLGFKFFGYDTYDKAQPNLDGSSGNSITLNAYTLDTSDYPKSGTIVNGEWKADINIAGTFNGYKIYNIHDINEFDENNDNFSRIILNHRVENGVVILDLDRYWGLTLENAWLYIAPAVRFNGNPISVNNVEQNAIGMPLWSIYKASDKTYKYNGINILNAGKYNVPFITTDVYKYNITVNEDDSRELNGSVTTAIFKNLDITSEVLRVLKTETAVMPSPMISEEISLGDIKYYLGAKHLMFVKTLSDSPNLPINNEYRRIGLIGNVRKINGSVIEYSEMPHIRATQRMILRINTFDEGITYDNTDNTYNLNDFCICQYNSNGDITAQGNIIDFQADKIAVGTDLTTDKKIAVITSYIQNKYLVSSDGSTITTINNPFIIGQNIRIYANASIVGEPIITGTVTENVILTTTVNSGNCAVGSTIYQEAESETDTELATGVVISVTVNSDGSRDIEIGNVGDVNFIASSDRKIYTIDPLTLETSFDGYITNVIDNSSTNESGYLRFSGDVLQVDQRKPVARSKDQQEEIKIVVSF